MHVQISKAVLDSYDIGEIRQAKVVTDGLVHKTYEIDTATGKYILQRLHPVLASQAIGKDFLAVTCYLEELNFPSPKAVLSVKGKMLVRDGKDVWRMQTKLAGKTIHVLKDTKMARACGEIYAKFHRIMDGFPHTFKSTKILHETEKVYDAFVKAVDKGSRRLQPASDHVVEEMIEFVRRELPKYFLPSSLPMRVIHGDPKISNILFDANGRAKAIIDLDTCNRRPLLVELGDAFRSWCGGAEDDPRNSFSLPIFRAAWAGYKKGAGDMMTKRELQYIPKAIGTITLELAARFLTDYFNDNYFGWDSSRYPSRRAHNLARAQGQIAEFRDYQKKLPAIEGIIGVEK
ncbi:phosphotransferase [Candidatus Uhrbacteria bacterium]|nr:phosphotransferase [Candidatus Uhrbacteria bacterium]